MDKTAAEIKDARELAAQIPAVANVETSGLDARSLESEGEKVVDAIEMLGEEKAAGFRPAGHSEVTAGMRYLHCSRTIHQLVTDRNRAVGIYLAVASLLFTASSALMNANPKGELIVPITTIQRWCLPLTFAVLAGMAVLTAFLLIRTRVGLIYEVAKMNALLDLPIGRVQRIGLLSIFFILQTIISLAGGCASGLLSVFLLALAYPNADLTLPAIAIGLAVTASLMILYVITVTYTTTDTRLRSLWKS
jgi:hypothetical protein